MKITRKIFNFGINKNGRNYSKKVAEQIIEQSKFLIDNHLSHGELKKYDESQNNSIICSANISHLVTRFFIGDECLKAEIEILDLPYGRVLKDDLDLFSFVPRGEGDIDVYGNIVNYKFIAIDAILKEESSFEI